MVSEILHKISHGLSVLVFGFALIGSATLISGDSFGRVNLLYLLLLFVLWPIVSLCSALLFAMYKRDKRFIVLLLAIPIWPRSWIDAITQLKRDELFHAWLFKESQKLVLFFSIGCLTSFVFVLLFNDVTFVWRSTLLSVEQVYPLLKAIAYPWFFLEKAQPGVNLVAIARDSRLTVNTDLAAASLWWRYVLMAQLCYALLPRLALYIWATRQFKQAIINLEATPISGGLMAHKPAQKPLLKSVSKNTQPLKDYLLLSWNSLPTTVLKSIEETLGSPAIHYELGANLTPEIESEILANSRDKVLIVAAWEPPMGQLEDFMQCTQGIIIPIDWQAEKLCHVSDLHLEEWRRFCYPLADWRLQQIDI